MVATSVRNRELKNIRIEAEDFDREICSFFNVPYRPIRTNGEAFVLIESIHSFGFCVSIDFSTCLFSNDKSVAVSIYKLGDRGIASANSADIVSAFKMACRKCIDETNGRLQ